MAARGALCRQPFMPITHGSYERCPPSSSPPLHERAPPRLRKPRCADRSEAAKAGNRSRAMRNLTEPTRGWALPPGVGSSSRNLAANPLSFSARTTRLIGFFSLKLPRRRVVARRRRRQAGILPSLVPPTGFAQHPIVDRHPHAVARAYRQSVRAHRGVGRGAGGELAFSEAGTNVFIGS